MDKPLLNESEESDDEDKYKKYTLNWLLLKRLWMVLRIIFPNFRTLTSQLLLALIIVRVLSEFVSYYLGLVPSNFFKVILNKDDYGVVKMIIKTVVLVAVAAMGEGFTKNFKGCLLTGWRQILCNKIHRTYFSRDNYYKLNVTDKTLDNTDQRITQDVDKMCRALIEVLVRLIMCPGILVFYSYQAYTVTGSYALIGSYVYVFSSAIITIFLTTPIVTSTTELEKCEGDFRFKHTNIRVNSEAVAFQNAQYIQWKEVNITLNSLCVVLQRVYNRSSIANVAVQFFNNLQDASAYIVIGIAFLFSYYKNKSDSDLSALIAANHFYMYYLTSTFGDVISEYELISQVAGTVHRIGELFEEMDKLSEKEKKSSCEDKKDVFGKHELSEESLISDSILKSSIISEETIQICEFKDVTATPPSDPDKIIFQNFSFTFNLNENVLITGTNSCGKTTILRLMRGLWRPTCGEVCKSNLLGFGSSAVYFQPQTILLCDGTLRQQVQFPETEPIVADDDDKIERCLSFLGLQGLVDFCDGFDKHLNWQETLSPTEKKIIALARILYHEPKVTVIDNIFSEVEEEIIDTFYRECQRLGMTLISVGDQNLLQQYHVKTIDLSSNNEMTSL